MAHTWKRKLEEDPSIYLKKLKLETDLVSPIIIDEESSSPHCSAYTVELPSDSDSEDDHSSQQPALDKNNKLNTTPSSQRYKVAPPFSNLLLYNNPTSYMLDTTTTPSSSSSLSSSGNITSDNNPYALVPYVDRGLGLVTVTQPLSPTTVDVSSGSDSNSHCVDVYEGSSDNNDDDVEPMDIE